MATGWNGSGREENMVFRTVEGVLHPDGKLVLSPEQLPACPVRVLVTLLEADEEAALAEAGDYLERLTDYEERLARGEIQWQ
jgi:hypothetical protein